MRRSAGRNCLIVGCGMLLAAGWVSGVEAASGDAAGIYTVTVTKVEVSSDGGGTFTTIFDGSKAINIAAADAGAVAAGLASGAAVAPGTYNRVRTTIGATLLLKGYVNNGATTIYTNGGTDTGAFTTNNSAADAPGGTYTTSTFTIPNRTSTMTVSIVVPSSGNATVRISFDTSGVITQSSGIPSVGAPTITVTSG